MTEQQPLKYRAFLSYSHADRRWATWLHRRLEAFHIDKDLAGRDTPLGVVPSTLRPIFRDRADFASGRGLRDATTAALDAAAALIVLCSPSSARSTYVNEEVRVFRWRHPDRPVVPVMIGGSYPEAFPPALRFEIDDDGTISERPITLLGADLAETADGRELGSAKLVAGLIGVAPDDIFRRAQRARRKRLRFMAAGALAVTLTIAVLGAFAEIQRRRFVNYIDLATAASAFEVRDATAGWYDPNQLANATLSAAQNVVSQLPFVGRVRILWFDDRPALSQAAKQRFLTGMRAIGVEIEEELDIEAAKARLAEGFDVAIANYGKAQERFAYQLLAEIRRLGVDTPVVIYGLDPNPSFAREAICYGAVARVTDIGSLFASVIRATAERRTAVPDSIRQRCIQERVKPFDTVEWQQWLRDTRAGQPAEPPQLNWD